LTSETANELHRSETKEIQWKSKDKASSDTREKTHCSSEERSTIRERGALRGVWLYFWCVFEYERNWILLASVKLLQT
jgi:hypothetical protein